MFIERRNADVTERQAHDSQPVRVQPGETPGSPVAALAASIEMSASKRRKTVSLRGGGQLAGPQHHAKLAASSAKPSRGEAKRKPSL